MRAAAWIQLVKIQVGNNKQMHNEPEMKTLHVIKCSNSDPLLTFLPFLLNQKSIRHIFIRTSKNVLRSIPKFMGSTS